MLTSLITHLLAKSSSHYYLVFLIFCLYNSGVSAQSIHFTYDNAGNRTSRSLITASSRSGSFDSHSLSNDMQDFNSEVILSLSDNILTLFLINYNQTTDCNIQLCTTDGMTLRKIHVTSAVTSINLSRYKNGVYIIRVDINGNAIERKIRKN